MAVERDGNAVEQTVKTRGFGHFEPPKPGLKTWRQYDGDIRDPIDFPAYPGQPAKLVCYRDGLYARVSSATFLSSARLLKKEYLKDVH